MKAGDGAGRHDDANQPLIKQLKQKRPSSKDTSRITISLTYTNSSCNEIQSLAGRMVVLSFGAEVEGTVQFTHLILILTYSCRILESSTVCSVCWPLPALSGRPARSLALCSLFFFFNSVVLFWQLTCCWPLLCLDDQVHSTFLLTRRPSPWVSSWEPNHCFAEASLEQKCALCAGRAGLSCTSSSFLPL